MAASRQKTGLERIGAGQVLLNSVAVTGATFTLVPGVPVVANGTIAAPTLAPTATAAPKTGSKPFEPDWPEADFIVGNPPFLGGNKLRNAKTGLGDDYVDALFEVYTGRVHPFADLCCYWHEEARDMIATTKAKRAGLLATQGIRGGANRETLARIKRSGGIFFAESDRPWVLDGAAVRVSMVGFDDGSETRLVLDGRQVECINADLTSSSDLTQAQHVRPAGVSALDPQFGGCGTRSPTESWPLSSAKVTRVNIRGL